MKEQIIERFGSIIKEENLWCRGELGIRNGCILESTEPFPGYYGHVPNAVKPKFIYLITKSSYSLEEIFRAFAKINKSFPSLDIAAAQIFLFGETLPGIRLGNLENFEMIRPLQEGFISEDIKFDLRKRSVANVPAMIKTTKFFKLKEYTDELVYIDMRRSSNSYFAIPENLDWQDFKKIVLHIKQNHTELRFDAARGFFFNFSDIIDVVRIFTKDNSFEYTNHLKKIFINKI
jgi:hypothetical protein